MDTFAHPQLGQTYQGYEPWQGHRTADEVRAAYTLKHGCAPAEVLWCKPGMWLAGPIEETKPATAPAVIASAIAAAPLVVAKDEPMESVPATGPESQTEWMQPSLI